MVLILSQLALLIFTAWGWGFWLWKLAGAARRPGWHCHGWFFFGLAGFMACLLFLHALIYCDLPLKYTSWAGLGLAAGGVLSYWWERKPRREPLVRRRRREILAASVLFVVVFAFQGGPLFHAGPANYYGSAHTDQVNYVLLAGFLVEKPFSTSPGDNGLQPWLAKALTLKTYRLGQSVANGYLGVVSLSDAKRAYGTLTIFMVGVGALSVFFLARVLAVPRVLAAVVGVWWGLLPAVTKMHLDGFLSQTCVLFVFPALAAVFYVRRGRLEYAPLLLLTVYLAYLLCTYTEVYVLGLGLVVAMTILAARTGTPWWVRAAAIGGVTMGSWALTGGYIQYFIHYIGGQYQAAAANPRELVSIVPMSGTWIGWKQIFSGYQPFADLRLERLSLLTGFAILFLIACAFQAGGLLRRRFLLAVIAPPAGVLVILLSAPEFSKYPFSKLLDTFTTFWLVFAVLGALSLRGLLPRRLPGNVLVWTGVVSLTLTALYGSWPQWRATWDDKEILADVDSPGARLCYAFAERNPAAVYVVDEHHSLVAAWLAYAARRSKVYMAVDRIADLPIPDAGYAFRKLPESSQALTVLDEKGPWRISSSHELSPIVVMHNPQGQDGGGENTSYWIGPDATLEVTDQAASRDLANRYVLEFDAGAGPANAVPERSLVLVSPNGVEQRIDFTSSMKCRFKVNLSPGPNLYTLKIVYPTAQTNWLPLDPRDHMVLVRHLVVTSLSPLPRDTTRQSPR